MKLKTSVTYFSGVPALLCLVACSAVHFSGEKVGGAVVHKADVEKAAQEFFEPTPNPPILPTIETTAEPSPSPTVEIEPTPTGTPTATESPTPKPPEPVSFGAISVTGVTYDSKGNMYFADRERHHVVKVSPTGVVSVFAGVSDVFGSDGDGGPATKAHLKWPYYVTADASDNIYIADALDSRVRKVTTDGNIITVAGQGTSCTHADTKSPSSCIVRSSCAAKNDTCSAATADIGDGKMATSAYLAYPIGLAVERDGTLYISDGGHSRVRVVKNGIIDTAVGNGVGAYTEKGNGKSISINGVAGIATDNQGHLYLAEQNTHHIKVFDTKTNYVSNFAGNFVPPSEPYVPTKTGSFSGDGGDATKAGLNIPTDVVLDGQGNLYFTDLHNYRIRKINIASKVISTVAGDGTHLPKVQFGDYAQAHFFGFALAIGQDGSLALTDYGNSRILKFGVEKKFRSVVLFTSVN